MPEKDLGKVLQNAKIYSIVVKSCELKSEDQMKIKDKYENLNKDS